MANARKPLPKDHKSDQPAVELMPLQDQKQANTKLNVRKLADTAINPDILTKIPRIDLSDFKPFALDKYLTELKLTRDEIFAKPAVHYGDAKPQKLSQIIDDLWVSIFLYLDTKSLVTFMQTCREARNLANDLQTRKRLFDNHKLVKARSLKLFIMSDKAVPELPQPFQLNFANINPRPLYEFSRANAPHAQPNFFAQPQPNAQAAPNHDLQQPGPNGFILRQ